MDTYLVAVKRQLRDQVEDDWSKVLESIEGVEPAPSPLRPDRIQVEATPAGIAKVRQCLGDICHIEPVLRHEVSE